MMEKSVFPSFEQARRKKGLFVMLVLSVLIVIAFIISVNTGYIRLSPMDLLRTMFGKGTDKQSLILFDFRLPAHRHLPVDWGVACRLWCRHAGDFPQ
jgi:iron complex transport system permease protein